MILQFILEADNGFGFCDSAFDICMLFSRNNLLSDQMPMPLVQSQTMHAPKLIIAYVHSVPFPSCMIRKMKS